MSVDGRYKLETTEHVELDFDLAGPGSRFCAWLIDALLKALLIVGLYFLLLMVFFGGLVGGLRGDMWVREAGGWALALVIFALFAITMFYHVIFEWLMRGQTPGKRQMGLRVIRDEGGPLNLTDVLIRNLLRIVDFMPAFYGLGGLLSAGHPLHKRLGDLAAGTIVVKETEADFRAFSTLPPVGAESAQEAAPSAVAEAANGCVLDAAERQLLERFLVRRLELTSQARTQLAERLAQPLYQRYGGHWDYAESYLERLLEGRHDAS